MSSRSQHLETLCSWRCGRPTRDGAYVCEDCLSDFAQGLRELVPSLSDRADSLIRIRVGMCEVDGRLVPAAEWCPWPRAVEVVPGLWDELQSTIVGERAISYGMGGPSGAIADEEGAVTVGLNLNENASYAAAELRKAMRHLVRLCQEYRVESLAPEGWSPRSASLVGGRPHGWWPPEVAEWLGWRVDAMAWQPEVADMASYVYALLDYARWVVDRPPTRQQLGDCQVDGCDGQLSAVEGAPFAACFKCRTQVEAQPLRDRLLGEMGDQLCEVADIARLSTYLGLRADRDRVRQRVKTWAYRDRIKVRRYVVPTEAVIDDDGVEIAVEIPPMQGPVCRGCGHDSCPDVLASRGVPLYRFGDAYALLLLAEAGSTHTPSRPRLSQGA